jgi:LuxR family maltose regulon positive regulatory protein
MGNVIAILVQLALACQAEGDRSLAAEHLGRALALGEPEGHMRVFLDAGPTLNAVLHSIGAGAPGALYARAVLSAAEQEPSRPDDPASTRPATRERPLVDSLSERELDVLRLLESDLGGPDIARELSVSVNTVRTHTRHIYAKLGVSTRREAVREAARLGLLHHTGR